MIDLHAIKGKMDRGERLTDEEHHAFTLAAAQGKATRGEALTPDEAQLLSDERQLKILRGILDKVTAEPDGRRALTLATALIFADCVAREQLMLERIAALEARLAAAAKPRERLRVVAPSRAAG